VSEEVRIDLRKVVEEGCRLFSCGEDLFLARREGRVVRVYEVVREGDVMLAFPIYEVEVGEEVGRE